MNKLTLTYEKIADITLEIDLHNGYKIISLVELADLIFSETDEHYAIAFSSYSKRHRLVIDKKDLAFRKG